MSQAVPAAEKKTSDAVSCGTALVAVEEAGSPEPASPRWSWGNACRRYKHRFLQEHPKRPSLSSTESFMLLESPAAAGAEVFPQGGAHPEVSHAPLPAVSPLTPSLLPRCSA